MKPILLFCLLFPLCLFSQSSHYDSLYNQGLISRGDWQLLRSTANKSVDSVAIKIASYDTLYAHGQISKSDRDMLISQSQSKKGDMMQQKDTLNELLDHYDSLFRERKLSIKDHQLLVDEAKARYKPVYYSWQLKTLNPKEARQLALNQTVGGAISMVLADVFMGVAIGRALNDSDNAGDITNGLCIGGTVVFRIMGIALLAHGGVLRHKADRYERDQMLLRR